jgi:hypothetical protein
MQKPIYSSMEHESIIEAYIIMCKDFAQEVSSPTKYQKYLEVLDIVIEYHNNYGSGVREDNWYDWLMIIPINLTVATNGFFAGLETKRNTTVIKAYRKVLNEMVFDVTDKIDSLKQVNE